MSGAHHWFYQGASAMEEPDLNEVGKKTYDRWTETGMMCALRNAVCEGCPITRMRLETLGCKQDVSNAILISQGILLEHSNTYRNRQIINEDLRRREDDND
jgi:hypothetical protein